MLSAQAYSFHQKSRLAISLSWVAGYTNVITFLLCGGVVVSHTTGNVTHFGEGFADGGWRTSLYFAFLFLAFFSGAIGSAFVAEIARRYSFRSKYILSIAIQAVLFIVLALEVHRHYRDDLAWDRVLGSGLNLFTLYWITGVGSLAMGFQNATITKVSGAVVRTTHLTGVTTDLGIESAGLLFWWYDRLRAGGSDRVLRVLAVTRRHPAAQRSILLASIIVSFLLGAILGTLIFRQAPTLAMLLPISFLLLILYRGWRSPIADVRELDPLADPEWAAAGLVKSLLPPELGIYRLSHHRQGRAHGAPDFQSWADRLPRKWRVIVLAVTPMTRLDANAFADLALAVQKLRTSGRDLILCGVTPSQYRAMRKSDLPVVLGFKNICVDLEFSIARAMVRLGE